VAAELRYGAETGSWNGEFERDVCGGSEEIRLPLVAESLLELEAEDSL
jgi:hypothetical protein